MNERQLRRLLRRVLLSAPLPLAVLGAACGGSSLTDFNSASGGAPSRAGAGGAPSAGASNGGATPVAGASSAGAGGAIAGAGAGGAIAGAGAGGAISRGGSGGSGGSGASAGAAASSGAGSGGSSGDSCKGGQAIGCAPVVVKVATACVDPSQAVVGTLLSQETCKSMCNAQFIIFSCSVSAVSTSDVSVLCNPGCAVGRRPEGMLETSALASPDAGEYFAQIAELEAASVVAFRVLRDELRAVGAPRALVRAAARAARDEIRHARATGALARRFGGTPRAAAVTRGALRSLEAMALENAVEGCVRETYGALLATRQARLANDPVVRAAMMRIARDETRHASLSWRVGRWLETRLDPAARRNVQQAKERAAHELRLSLANEPARPFADVAGLPSPAEAVALAERMNRLLWS